MDSIDYVIIRNPVHMDMDKETEEKLEALMSQRRPNLYLVADLCHNKIIPARLRIPVWGLLLRIEKHNSNKAEELLSSEIATAAKDMENQRVIEMDTKRTNAEDPFFQEDGTRKHMEKLLTFYCKRKSLSYKQGLNFVLAPFMKIQKMNDTEGSGEKKLGDGHMFELFYAFVERLMPNMFTDNEFRSLQYSLKVFRLLLMYHDPQLGAILDQNDVIPELYATPWFLTLFSRTLPLKALYVLWDHYLVSLAKEEFLYVHFFVCLGVLMDSRESILGADKSEIPAVASRVPPKVDTEDEAVARISVAIARAEKLREATPSTFLKLVYEVAFAQNIGTTPYFEKIKALNFSFRTIVDSNPFDDSHMKSSKQTYMGDMLQKALDQLLVLPIQPQEILRNLQQVASEGSTSAQLKFFILDCRPLREFNRSHFATSFHMDPRLLDGDDIERLESLLDGFRSMNAHFVFMGTDNDVVNSIEVAKFVLFFLQKGFRYVSACLEGYAKCVEMIADSWKNDLVVGNRADADDGEDSIISDIGAGLRGLGLVGWLSTGKKMAAKGVKKIGAKVSKVKSRVKSLSFDEGSRSPSPSVGKVGASPPNDSRKKEEGAGPGFQEEDQEEVAVKLFGTTVVGAYSSIKSGVFSAWTSAKGGKQAVGNEKVSSTVASIAANLKKDAGTSDGNLLAQSTAEGSETVEEFFDDGLV